MIAAFQNLLNIWAESFDLPILDWIQANMANPFLDFIMPIITVFGDAGIFWIAWAVLLLLFPKTRKIGLGMGFALIMGLLICNVTLKPLVGRIRPYDLQAELGITIQLLGERMHDFSFPSGHTQASFAAATAICFWKRKWGIPALILASLTAFSRMYLYVHYPTDVLAGICFGLLFATIGLLISNRLFRGKKDWDGCTATS